MQNDVLHPNEISFRDIWINSLGAFIAWVSWSILLLVLVLISSSFFDIPWEFSSEWSIVSTTNVFFPFFLSFITFLVTELVLFSSYIFLTYTSPDRYERSTITFTQIAILSILIYIFITPIYIFAWVNNYDNIIYVFVAHILILYFVLMLVLEVLNNYRYILLGLYSSIVSILITGFMTVIIFSIFPQGNAKLIALLVLIPVVNFMCIFFKWLFDYVYYLYYKHTGSDNLWDIFNQLQIEADEALKQATQENSI